MQADKKLLGAFGEDEACKYLRRHGYRLISRNFSCRFGEIDVIAQKRGFLAFVEVKLRKDRSHGEAREFVTAAKQQRVIRTAEYWLASHPTELQPRFDVIEIYAPQGTETRKPEILHIEDAYQL